MKAPRILLSFPILLFLGGCLAPIPFDHPGYPRNNSSLRYPLGETSQQNLGRYNERYNYNRGIENPNRSWDDPPTNARLEDQPQNGQTIPGPISEPKPKPEERELVRDIDPIKESAKPKFPYAIPVQNADNLVVSPFAKDGPYLDTAGLSSGTQIECEVTGKTILVP